eukprot:149468-Heterocapsa_arctica.AAC.1
MLESVGMKRWWSRPRAIADLVPRSKGWCGNGYQQYIVAKSLSPSVSLPPSPSVSLQMYISKCMSPSVSLPPSHRYTQDKTSR